MRAAWGALLAPHPVLVPSAWVTLPGHLPTGIHDSRFGGHQMHVNSSKESNPCRSPQDTVDFAGDFPCEAETASEMHDFLL